MSSLVAAQNRGQMNEKLAQIEKFQRELDQGTRPYIDWRNIKFLVEFYETVGGNHYSIDTYALLEYGCFCQFIEPKEGKGEPVDELDQ